jgi:hypothetical protein
LTRLLLQPPQIDPILDCFPASRSVATSRHGRHTNTIIIDIVIALPVSTL